MNVIQVGVAAALIVLSVADANAQQYSGAVPGTWVNVPTSGGPIVSQSIVAGGLPDAPIVTGTFLGEPGGFVGRPVIGGSASAGPITTTFAPAPAQGRILPYSYWVTAPQPARIYVQYGANDQFPFYGRPYGSPNDRWSWYYMGGGDSRYLARYYYPPLQ